MTTKTLFDNLDEFATWHEHWQDMPEFVQDDLQPYQQIIVSFETKQDVEEFAKLIDQKLTYKTKSIWFPKKEKQVLVNKRYES